MLQTKPCRHGTLTYHDHDKFIGRVLDLYGEYSEGEVDIMRMALRKGDTAIDAGANIGALTVPMAKIVGSQGKVIAFEPQPKMHWLLTQNLAANCLGWVEALQFAVGKEPGKAFIDPPDYDANDNFGGVEVRESGSLAIDVAMIDSLRLPSLRLLKADVEGMEFDVLQGAVETIGRCRPVIYVECNMKNKLGPLAKFLAARDYRMYWHLPLMYQPNNFFNNADSGVFEKMISMNVLAIAREEGVEIPALQEITVQKRDKFDDLQTSVA